MASSFPFKKNTAVTIVFPIYDADGDLVPDAADLDSEYSLDGAVFVDCSNEATNIDNIGGVTHSGLYSLTLVAGETNGDVVCIQVKTSTVDAKTTVLVFYPAAQTLDEDYAGLAKTGEAAAASSQGEAAAASSQGEAQTWSAQGEAQTWSSQGEAATASSQGEAAAALATWTSTYAAQLTRMLGLMQENQYIDTTVFDTDDHMTSARLRTYSVAGSVGTDNDVLATYTVTATYDASGNMVTFKVVKV
jgi:hypothetical protein